MLTLVALLMSCALTLVGESQESPRPSSDGFPVSVWRDQKQVTQIPCVPSIGSTNLARSDLRQEFYMGSQDPAG